MYRKLFAIQLGYKMTGGGKHIVELYVDRQRRLDFEFETIQPGNRFMTREAHHAKLIAASGVTNKSEVCSSHFAYLRLGL